MKPFRFLLAHAVLIAALCGTAAAQSADDIVAKHIQAMGGREKLAALKTLVISGTVSAGPAMKNPLSVTIVNGRAWRQELTIQNMKLVMGFDGKTGWILNPFQGRREADKLPEDGLRGIQAQTDLTGPLFDYKQKGSQVEYLGMDDMEGSDAHKLRVIKKDGTILYIWLDAVTYMELLTVTKIKMPDKDIESEIVRSNYKQVDGITFAFTVENRQKGATSGQVINYDDIKVNTPVDDDIFRMPGSTTQPGRRPVDK